MDVLAIRVPEGREIRGNVGREVKVRCSRDVFSTAGWVGGERS